MEGIRVGERGTYVEGIAHNNVSNPFVGLWSKYGVREVQRLPEHQGIEIGERILVKTKMGELRYGLVSFIVRVISKGRLAGKVFFLIQNIRQELHPAICVSDRTILRKISEIKLRRNTIFITEAVREENVYNGYALCSIGVSLIIKHKITPKEKIGVLRYTVSCPPTNQRGVNGLFCESHVCKKTFLNDLEIKKLKKRGVFFQVIKNISQRTSV